MLYNNLIFFILSKGDFYGYQISSLIGKLTDNRVTVPESTLYPTLYKLLGNNYISDREVQVGKRRTRVYYHIEESGKAHLQSLLTEYNKNTSGICKILACDSLDDAE